MTVFLSHSASATTMREEGERQKISKSIISITIIECGGTCFVLEELFALAASG